MPARKMEERVRNRTNSAPAFAPTAVALGPDCPCSTPSLPTTPTLLPAKRVEGPPHTRRVEKSTPVGKSARRKPPPDEIVVVRRPQPDPGVPPGAIMEGIGLGIGLCMGGGMGGGMRGGGMEGGGYRR